MTFDTGTATRLCHLCDTLPIAKTKVGVSERERESVRVSGCCDTRLSMSDASSPWLQIKNTCTVAPRGAGWRADWQRERKTEGEKKKVKTGGDSAMHVKWREDS